MDEAYTWHPGAHRLASKWPIPVNLQPDELLSSWLVRAALSHGCDPLSLTSQIWPVWRVWTRDIDRGISRERLIPLSTLSGIPVEAFERAALSNIIPGISSKPLNPNQPWPWLLGLGTRNRKHRGGLQLCPICLSEDKKPYYRVQWRFAWHTCCIRHESYLYDQCPVCHAAIEPQRLTAPDRSPTICATCQMDLSKLSSTRAHKALLNFQQLADSVLLQRAVAVYAGKPVPVVEWFELVHYFSSLLRKVVKSQPKGLLNLLERFDVELSPDMAPSHGLALEYSSLDNRKALIAGAAKLLDVVPDTLFDEAAKMGIYSTAFQLDHTSTPGVLIPGLARLPLPPGRRAKRQTSVIKPRPKEEVIKMWQALLKKL